MQKDRLIFLGIAFAGILSLIGIIIFVACVYVYPRLFPPQKPFIPFAHKLDMNDPLNRQKFFQLTNLDFPDSVVWEEAHITYNPIPQHIFDGSATMTRKDFDAVFSKVTFREWGDHIGSPDHPYQGTADFPRSNCNLRVSYERSFETNKAENPEALVHIHWGELKAKNEESPFTPEIVKEFQQKLYGTP